MKTHLLLPLLAASLMLVGCGVKTLLIRNGRQVEPRISAQAWMVVDSPREALELTLACLA